MISKLQKKQRYVAVQEHELAVLAFAEAMRNADVAFMSMRPACWHEGYRFTPNMEEAWARYERACLRLHDTR